MQKQLSPQAFQLAEYARQVWRVTAPADTKIEDLLVPSFWGHIAQSLRSGDLIEVVSEDNSWFADLYVRWARRLEASVSLKNSGLLEARAVTDDQASEYMIKFRGARSKFTILKGKDVVKDGFETENQAQAYLTDYLKQLAA